MQMTVLFIDGAARGGIEKSVLLYSESLTDLGISTNVIFFGADENQGFNRNYVYLNSVRALIQYFTENNIYNIIFFKNYSKFFWLKFFVKNNVFVRSSNTPLLLFYDFSFKRFLAESFKLLTYNVADYIISNSIENSLLLKRLYFKPIIVMRNFEVPQASNSLPKFENTTFVFMGRLERQKNPLLVIESFSIAYRVNPNLRLIVIGDGSNLSTLKNLVLLNNIQSAVRFEPFNIDKSRELSRSHCAIFTSKYEGLPNVLLEYMSFNLPIIYNTCKTGVAELMEGYNYSMEFSFQNKMSLANRMLAFRPDRFNRVQSNSHRILDAMKIEFSLMAKKYLQ